MLLCVPWITIKPPPSLLSATGRTVVKNSAHMSSDIKNRTQAKKAPMADQTTITARLGIMGQNTLHPKHHSDAKCAVVNMDGIPYS